jgi:hypothetical protein
MTHPRRLGVDGVVDAPSDGIDVSRWRGLATEEEAPASASFANYLNVLAATRNRVHTWLVV